MSALTADNLMALDNMDTEDMDAPYGGYSDQRGSDRSDSGSSARFDSEEERQDRLLTPRELAEIERLENQLRESTTVDEKRAVVAQLIEKHTRVKPTVSDETDPENSGPMMWYFAYGSNMNVAQLLTRIGAFEEKKLMYLNNFRLCFNKRVSLKARTGCRFDGRQGTNPMLLGFANVEPSAGDRVYGIAYLVHETQVQQMDVYEGVANGHYTRETMTCYDSSNHPYTCAVYVACKAATADNLLPTEGYMSHLLGGRGLLPPAYVEMLERHPRVKK